MLFTNARFGLDRLASALQEAHSFILHYPEVFFTSNGFKSAEDYLSNYSVSITSRESNDVDCEIYHFDIGPAFVFVIYPDGELCLESGQPIGHF